MFTATLPYGVAKKSRPLFWTGVVKMCTMLFVDGPVGHHLYGGADALKRLDFFFSLEKLNLDLGESTESGG